MVISNRPSESSNKPKPKVDKNVPKIKDIQAVPKNTFDSLIIGNNNNQLTLKENINIGEQYNTVELIFTNIIDDLKDQIKSNISATSAIDSILQNNDLVETKYNPSKNIGHLSTDYFEILSLIEMAKQNPTPRLLNNLGNMATVGVGFQHNLSQKIIIIQSILETLKQNKIVINQSKINKFYDYYDSLEKAVTHSQKELAIAIEPYYGHTLGYHELVVNPTKFITTNFRANPYYSPGDIVKSTEDGSESTEIGKMAENTINSEISKLNYMVMVVAGPNFSILDTVDKTDSLSFYAFYEVEEDDKNRLIELTYELAYATYQESLIEDYQNADFNKVRKHEVIPQSYIDGLKEIEQLEIGKNNSQNQFYDLSNQIKLLDNQIEVNKNVIDEIKSKSSKADLNELKIILKANYTIDNLLNDRQTILLSITNLNQEIINYRKKIESIKAETLLIYESYNPQGLAVPISLSPQGQIEIYDKGHKTIFKAPNYSDYTDPKNTTLLKQEIDSLLIKYKIRVNAIQIKQNVNTPKVRDAIKSGKITGAIGIIPNSNSKPATLEESIEASLNISRIKY